MIINNNPTYRCEFCGKVYLRKHFAEYHEKVCNKNPAILRPCHDCVFLTKKETKIYICDNYYTGEPLNEIRNFLFCKKKQIFLYTPKHEIKGNHNHIDEEGGNFENHPMPKECNLFSSKY